MNIHPQVQRMELIVRKRQLVTLPDFKKKMAVECKDGLVWITSSSGYLDTILQPDQRYQPKRSGSVVIEALDDACVYIEEP